MPSLIDCCPLLANTPMLSPPPSKAVPLAKWFAEAVRQELDAVQKDKKKGHQDYELHAGKSLANGEPEWRIYRFILADDARIPDEADGLLRYEGKEYRATVIGQDADRIDIRVRSDTRLPTNIPQAVLTVDKTALLKKLASTLESIASRPACIGPLTIPVFHPQEVKADNKANLNAIIAIESPLREILEHCCLFPVSYLWGPPGTGKTHAIAHLVKVLIEAGERTLVTSHTHAAVDQVLYETVKMERGVQGPLFGHRAVSDGAVLRIGETPNRKIPADVRLDKVVERKRRQLENRIDVLRPKEQGLMEEHKVSSLAGC
jgi:AAA domain-containing protein